MLHFNFHILRLHSGQVSYLSGRGRQSRHFLREIRSCESRLQGQKITQKNVKGKGNFRELENWKKKEK